MELIEAVKARHSVRRYLDKPIEQSIIDSLNDQTETFNREAGLHFQLVTGEPKAFAGSFMSYGKFEGVSNYVALIAPKEAKEKVGYYGEKIVLLAQTLGLNSCWVGLTYKKMPDAYRIREGEKLHCVVALGYGLTQGVPHPLKDISHYVGNYSESMPQWFKDGVHAAMLCPTALNQQKFKFFLEGGNTVKAVASFSMAGYTMIDLGIAKCHFEIGAGKDNFLWSE